MGRKTGWQVSKRIKITQWVPEGILLVERGGGHDNKQQHCREKPRASQPLAADCVGYAFVRFSRGHGMMSMGGIGLACAAPPTFLPYPACAAPTPPEICSLFPREGSISLMYPKSYITRAPPTETSALRHWGKSVFFFLP